MISTCDPTCEQVNFDFGLGYNWVATAWPYVADRCGAPWFVLLSGQVLRFCPSEDQHAVWSPGGCDDCQPISEEQANSGDRLRYKLFYNDQGGEFVLHEDSGAIWRFHGFCEGGHPGRFKSYQHNDESAEVDGFTGYGHIQQILFQVSGVLAGRYDYSYQVFGDDAERLTKATHYLRDETGTMQKVREAEYAYYGDSEAHGSLGDLKTVTVTDYSAAGADPSRTYYYRYELLASGARRIKYALDPEAFERLSDDPRVTDPFTASDEIVAEYADYAFEYNPDGSVIQECTAGCEHPITYSFEEGTAAEGYNNWRLRAAETGSYVVTFTNFRGDVLLREVKETAGAQDSAVEYFQYDDNGNLILHATPAAVESYSYNASSLSVTLQANEGLIHVYEYYTQTTTASGGVGVNGFRQYDKIKKGSSGTPITLRKYEYTERSVPVVLESGSSSSSSSSSSGSPPMFTIYPLLWETVYRNEDGTGAITTSYSYAWHPNSLQIEQRVTTLPAVPAEQGGSGSLGHADRAVRYQREPHLEQGRARVHHLPRVRRGATGGYQDDPGRGRHAADLAQRLEHAAGGGLHLVTDYRVRSPRPADPEPRSRACRGPRRGGNHGPHGQLDGLQGCRPGDAFGARVLCARDGKLRAGQPGLDHQAQRRRYAERVDPGHAGLDRRRALRLGQLPAVQLRALVVVAGRQPRPHHGQPAVPHASRQRRRGSRAPTTTRPRTATTPRAGRTRSARPAGRSPARCSTGSAARCGSMWARTIAGRPTRIPPARVATAARRPAVPVAPTRTTTWCWSRPTRTPAPGLRRLIAAQRDAAVRGRLDQPLDRVPLRLASAPGIRDCRGGR